MLHYNHLTSLKSGADNQFSSQFIQTNQHVWRAQIRGELRTAGGEEHFQGCLWCGKAVGVRTGKLGRKVTDLEEGLLRKLDAAVVFD